MAIKKIRSLIYLLIFATIFPACSDSGDIVNTGRFVSTDWLQDHLEDPNLVLLFIGTADSHESIHIPHSRRISVRELLIDTDSLEDEFPEINIIDSVLESHGISDQSRIIIYYQNEMTIPSVGRLFLTLDYVGLGEQTSVMNGGIIKWMDEGRPVTDSTYSFPAGSLNLTGKRDLIVNARDVEGFLKNKQYILFDARPEELYSGQYEDFGDENAIGHIEGAINLPFEYFLVDSLPHVFKPDNELMQEFEKAGAAPEKVLVHSCRTGIYGSANYLIANHLDLKSLFYDGSFQEWSQLGLPVIKPVENKINSQQ